MHREFRMGYLATGGTLDDIEDEEDVYYHIYFHLKYFVK